MEKLIEGLENIKSEDIIYRSTVYNLIGYIQSGGEIDNSVFKEFLENNMRRLGGYKSEVE